MNPNIILAGSNPDLVSSLARGTAAARQANTVQRENALSALFKQQGAGIMSGNQNALNALSQHDPRMALDVQSTQLGMDATRQNMAAQQERLRLARETSARQAAQWAATLDAQQAQQSREKITSGLSMAAAAYQAGDEPAYNQILQQNGMDPAEYPMSDFLGLAARFQGIRDALEFVQEQQAGPKPADEYQRYVQEEQQAGRQPLTRVEFAQAKKGSEVIYGPDGTPILERGPAGSVGKFNESQSKANVYATRAEGALADLEPLADVLTSLPESVADGLPYGQYIQSSEYQRAATAGREFLQAILRKDTGAAITTQEVEEYGKVYLPAPGDKPETLTAKAEARRRALAALQSGMSPEQMLAKERALEQSEAPTGDWTDIGNGYRIREKQ